MPDAREAAVTGVRPRHALQHKLVLWTIALVIVPTLVSGLWLNHLTRLAFEEDHARAVDLLATTLAAALADQLPGTWSPSANEIIDEMILDPRIAVVAVSDRDGNVLHRRTADPEVWSAMTRIEAPTDAITTPLHDALQMPDGSVALIRRVPVWSGQRTEPAAEPRELRGYATLALRDSRLPIMLGRLQMTQLGVICFVCLVMAPLVVFAVARWLAPLRDLLTAITELSAGSRPEPLPESGNDDELGLLARSFNNMTGQLLDARHQLEQANRELEDKVRLRTEELEHANQRLQTEIDDKNEFLRAVSHDLGAPLRNISGMAGMLLMKYRADLADDALNKLERISANAKLQTELIGDLLELSKIRTRPGRKEQVDLDELVRDIVASLAYDLERSGIELIVHGDLPVIQAERNRMRQVFQNLLDNAVKYMLDAPTRRIEVTAETTDEAYRFTVADTGKGIAAQDLPGIFNVFSRATHSGTHAVAGRGVGLASVKSIVETYGGRITARSTPGQGSAFTFTLARSCVSPSAGQETPQIH